VSRKSKAPDGKVGGAAATVLAEKHLGLIAGRCLHWWWRLPSDVRTWYSEEDLISEAVMLVYMRTAKYDATRARETTFVYHVVENFCKGKLGHFQAKKFAACETLELAEIELAGSFETSDPRDCQELRRSKDAVERVIEMASDAVREFIDKIFNGGSITNVPIHEFLAATESAGATYDDFERVYKAVVG
jgi:hypothetical protein